MGVTQFSIFQDGSYPSTGWNMLNGQSANTMAGNAVTAAGFQNSTTNTFGTPGFVSLYYNGTTFNGPAFSVLNPDSGEIASSFYTYNAGGQLWNPGTNAGGTNAGGSYNYYDGNWTAQFQNHYPNQVFYGSGVISLGQPNNATSPSPINQANGGPNIVQISYQVSGVRVSSSTSKIY